jgi:hypothetical protein
MDLKKLLLLKLVCCGGPLLVFVVASVGVSAVAGALAGVAWYLGGAAIAVAGFLVLRGFRPTRGANRGIKEPADAVRWPIVSPEMWRRTG